MYTKYSILNFSYLNKNFCCNVMINQIKSTKSQYQAFKNLWMKFLLCTYSILLSIWSASSSIVFRENLRWQNVKRSSSEGPSSSITSTLYSPSLPYHLIEGIPHPSDITCVGKICYYISMTGFPKVTVGRVLATRRRIYLNVYSLI